MDLEENNGKNIKMILWKKYNSVKKIRHIFI